MATLPSVPTFSTGQTPSIATLNQLSYCVTFLTVIPAFGQFTVLAQSIVSGTNTAISWTKVTDRDGGWSSGNPTRYTAQTGGYYQFAAQIACGVGTGAVAAWFQVTTGSNNPGGSGHTQSFGYAGGAMTGGGGFELGELSPYLYVLDYVELYVFQNSGSASGASGAMQVTLESLGP